jgi:hypothetical protein
VVREKATALRLLRLAQVLRTGRFLAGLEVSRWSILCYACYVLLASFVLVSVLIGVAVTSLDEARDMEAPERTVAGSSARCLRSLNPFCWWLPCTPASGSWGRR